MYWFIRNISDKLADNFTFEWNIMKNLAYYLHPAILVACGNQATKTN